jgi:hypothetical protein
MPILVLSENILAEGRRGRRAVGLLVKPLGTKGLK